jgi:hypothetical protein
MELKRKRDCAPVRNSSLQYHSVSPDGIPKEMPFEVAHYPIGGKINQIGREREARRLTSST